MPKPATNPSLSRTSSMDWPHELLEAVKNKARDEDENVSSLIRRVMAEYVGWSGPTRNITGYGER